MKQIFCIDYKNKTKLYHYKMFQKFCNNNLAVKILIVSILLDEMLVKNYEDCN